VSVDSEEEVFHATATRGHSLQLACDVQAAQHLIWTRLGVSLRDIPQFKASLQIQNQILIQFY